MSEWTVEQLKPVAHILVGAAHADGQVQLEEESIILQLLAGLLGRDELPDELIAHLGRFDPERFDLPGTCKALELDGPDDRHQLLQLVAQVTEVDDVHDLDESHYILQVARAINAVPEEYEDLTFDATYGEVPPLPRS